MYEISYKLIQFGFILLVSILINIILSIYWYYNATEDDFANLPKRNLNKKNNSLFDERFTSIFYFNCSTYGTLGDALIYPKSIRARLYTSLYILLVNAGLLTAFSITYK
jgi:hypothetical protein